MKTTVGLDIAKQIFQAHGADRNGKVVSRKRLRRAEVASFFAGVEPCLNGTGSQRWSALLVSSVKPAGAYSAPDRAAVCDGCDCRS